MDIAQLWPFHSDFIIVTQRYETAILLAGFYVTETDHVSFERRTTDCEQSVSEVALFLSLAVASNTLLHAFGDAVLYNRKPETDFLVRNDPSDRVLSDFELTQGVKSDYISDVGNVAVSKLVVSSLHSQMRPFDLQNPAISQVFVFHLFGRVQEIVFTLSKHSDVLAYFVVLLQVLNDMGIS